jgi:hypothetical protein
MTEREREEIVMFLKRDQLVSDKCRPVPPARLSRRAKAGLWTLRVFAIAMSAMVVYTFIVQLGH